MKKIALTLVLFFLLSVVSFAESDPFITNLVEDPDPFGLGYKDETEDPYAELSELECLHKGLIRVYDGLTPSDLYGYMQVVDNSEGKFHTQKLAYLFDLILYYYYEDIDADELFERFISKFDYIDTNDMDSVYDALLTSLDKFSYHLDSESAESFFAPLDTKAVGISTVWQEETQMLPAGMYVNSVARFSSAEKAGIKKGDRLLKINGRDVRGLGFYGVSAIISEESSKSDFLDYTFEKEGEGVFTYTLERTEVSFPEYSVEWYEDKKVFFIDIDSFMYHSTALELSALIDDAYEKGYRKIIIDLQDNRGGSVDVAAMLASKFVAQPLRFLFSMGKQSNRTLMPFYSKGDGYEFDSVKILVNGNTASSAEIFTDTLRKNSGAKVYGSRTYGKGVAQITTQFIDGSAVGITAYVVYDKNGETYNEKGIIPDVIIYPDVIKNSLPIDLENFTFLNYETALLGEDNAVVMGLEKRLRLIDYLSPYEVDGIFDEDTALAIYTLQINYGLQGSGVLNEETFDLITSLVDAWSVSFKVTKTLFDYIIETI